MPKPPEFNIRADQPNKICRYIHRFCNQTRLDGYNYCIRHILEDKSAPFKQCTYVHPINKKRCTNAAPKTDKSRKRTNSLCPWHTKRALQKSKILLKKKKYVEGSTPALLRDLEHYCSNPRHDPHYTHDAGLMEKYNISDPEDNSLLSLDSQSEGSTATSLKDTFRRVKYDGNFPQMPTSVDPLMHCGVYTSKEVLKIAISKAVTLKSLYNESLKKTLDALHSVRQEYLAEASKIDNGKKHLEERDNNAEAVITKGESEQLKALEKYHQPSAVNRLFCHLSDMKYKKIQKTYALCVFVENGKKCNGKSILQSKYCFNHILNDPHQVLFKPCGLGKNTSCNNPVLPIQDDVSCQQHLHLTLLGAKTNEATCAKPSAAGIPVQEQEHFQSMDDIASLGLDAITPGSLFGLDQFGEPGESTDAVLTEDQTDLMSVQPVTLNVSSDVLYDTRQLEDSESK